MFFGGLFGLRPHLSAAPAEAMAMSSDNPDEIEHIELTVKGLYIYIYSSRAVTVRLYSILGQLIVQQAVQPGSTRLKAPAKGVYILKAGSVTRRVTINS